MPSGKSREDWCGHLRDCDQPGEAKAEILPRYRFRYISRKRSTIRFERFARAQEVRVRVHVLQSSNQELQVSQGVSSLNRLAAYRRSRGLRWFRKFRRPDNEPATGVEQRKRTRYGGYRNLGSVSPRRGQYCEQGERQAPPVPAGRSKRRVQLCIAGVRGCQGRTETCARRQGQTERAGKESRKDHFGIPQILEDGHPNSVTIGFVSASQFHSEANGMGDAGNSRARWAWLPRGRSTSEAWIR